MHLVILDPQGLAEVSHGEAAGRLRWHVEVIYGCDNLSDHAEFGAGPLVVLRGLNLLERDVSRASILPVIASDTRVKSFKMHCVALWSP